MVSSCDSFVARIYCLFCVFLDTQAAIAEYTTMLQMPDVPVDERATALFHRGVIYSQLGDTQADFTTLIQMPDAPADQKARALLMRGLNYTQLGDTQAALEDYTTLIQLPEAREEQKAKAFFYRGIVHWKGKDWIASKADFEAALAQPRILPEDRTKVLFALSEPMVAIEPLQRVVAALSTAFEEGDKTLEAYGGTPGDLLSMIVQRGPSEWAGYATAIAPLYIQHCVAEKLGRGITQSIKILDEGDFSPTQLELWYQAWQRFGQESDELLIPFS